MKLIFKIIFLSFSILISCSSKTEIDISNQDNELFERLSKGKIFFETVYNTQRKRIFNALKNSSSDSVIKFKEVLKRIIDGK